MVRVAPIALCIAIVLSMLAFATPRAHADGKVFLSIATGSDADGSTMPRQRAIIAFKDGVQHLAIDTAFTGAGEEFAWLVPLPSEPEILPATKGMFDTASMITAPRVSGRDAVMAIPAVILCGVLFGFMLNIRLWAVLLLIVLILLFVVVLLPALSMARSLPAGSLAVELRSEQQVGVYDTVVLRATDASELMAWLGAEGYAAPDEAGSVMQEYLDRGWVFAAAKLRDDSETEGERRAHPLQFRFAVEQPVYPMALTAVGNEMIELEMFVFAQGSASCAGLESVTSFAVQMDPRGSQERWARYLQRSDTVAIAHPGLIDIASGLSSVTYLNGRLSPTQQREDIVISVGEPTVKDPLLRTPAARWSIVVSAGMWISAAVGLVWLLLAGLSPTSASKPGLLMVSARGPWLAAILGSGLVAASVVYATTPVYRGALGNGFALYRQELHLESIGQALEKELAARSSLPRKALLNLDDLAEYPTGDSPLHYRIEFNDDETEARFIWHDLIGGEHRVVIPIRPGDGAGEAGP